MIDGIKEFKNDKLLYGSSGKNLISPFVSDYPPFEPKIKIAILASGNGSNFQSCSTSNI